jgi:putative membrane protein
MLADFDIRILADVNASLNALAFVLILAGLVAIKRRNEGLHRGLMLAATAVSALFLISYLTYHTNAEPVRFAGEGAIRVVYLAVLWTHIPLAAVQVPLILLTIRAGLRDQRERHRRLAKITAPIWLYVSVSGVVVYLMLYRF